MDEQNKNLLLATALSFMVILTWFILFPPEEIEQPFTPDPGVETVETQTDGGAILPNADPAQTGAETLTATEETAIDAPRLPVETPRLSGSISLQGGRIDDLDLTAYRETLDDGAELVRLLSPVGEPNAYYALYGWAPGGGVEASQVPGPSTIWDIEEGETLAPETPVTLIWDNGNGLVFRRTISIDEDYMFSIGQSVENTTDTAVSMAPYGIVARHGEPNTENFFISREAVVYAQDGEIDYINYDDMPDLSGGRQEIEVDENGWIGFIDKYWMATLIPEPGQSFTATARFNRTRNVYQTEIVFPTLTIAAGETTVAESHLFAGAKEWETLRSYQNDDGIDRFLDAIDWGWFFFLTKPIFALLHWLNALIGNMGWAIIGLTLVIKAVLLPLAYKSYVSMAKMKELQPEMEKLREQAGDDRQKMQQGMMKLYKDNKVNPASGCLPILLQIPIFFSLYKVIFVTLELRHAPWFGWIKDLSAPDPSSIFNLWGIFPWAAPASGTFMALIFIGILPLLLGISMWLQQKLNPAPPDPTQRAIFAWMPWVFMFMLGSFASGLVIYWCANNILTFTQQYAIMRSQGVDVDFLGNVKKTFKRKPKEG